MSPIARLLIVAAVLGCAVSAGGGDRRIQTTAYADGAVVRLAGCPKFQTMVHFGKGEQIENVGLGDAAQWQVVPNKRADLLFVKPLAADAFSNMTVVTDRHSYAFELKSASAYACRRGDVVYDLRFHYNDPPPVAAAPPPDPESLLPLPEKRNTAYTYSGDKHLVPMRAFDDGKSTYLKWAEGVPVPAIYAAGADNTEALVNFASRGEYIVVEQVARAFTLRRGEHAATLYNDAFVVPALDALSPQPATDRNEHGLWPF
jgi:type IV secretion system protein VirB9